MSQAIVTISFTVGMGYRPGDYAVLYGNGGSGAIDWETPLNGGQRYELFPGGAGIYGFGHAPFGRYPFGHAASLRTPGFGHCPFGHAPFGHGAVTINARTIVTACGTYLFGLACYDAAGNEHEGTPQEVSLAVCIAPNRPTGLQLNSYNKTTNVLILDVNG